MSFGKNDNKKCILFLIKRGIFIQIYMKKILKNENFIFLHSISFFYCTYYSEVSTVFFFILTREITETVSNRIRYGPIKSFFSHFWFFISIFFLSFYSFFFFRLYILSFYHSFYFDEILFKISSLFLIFQFFFWNITIYYSIYFLKLKLFYLNILKMSCILFYLYIVRMKHLNHINRNIIRGKNMKFCFKKVKNKFYWYNIYT